jgi:hypothetical protein
VWAASSAWSGGPPEVSALMQRRKSTCAAPKVITTILAVSLLALR